MLMTEQQRLIHQLIENAADDAPVIESIEELTVEKHMKVPDQIKKAYPERRWKWLDIKTAISQVSTSGGLWVIATRANCSKINPKLWDMDGGITYRQQNILGFTRRQIGDLIEKRIIDGFAQNKTLSTDLRKDFSDSSGKHIGHMERVTGSEIEADYGHTDLTSELTLQTGEVLPADTVDFEA